MILKGRKYYFTKSVLKRHLAYAAHNESYEYIET